MAVARRRECEREAMEVLARVLGSVQASLDEKKAELATKTAEKLQAAAVETARLMARLSALEAGSGPAAGRELAGAEGAAGGDATALEAPGGGSAAGGDLSGGDVAVAARATPGVEVSREAELRERRFQATLGRAAGPLSQVRLGGRKVRKETAAQFAERQLVSLSALVNETGATEADIAALRAELLGTPTRWAADEGADADADADRDWTGKVGGAPARAQTGGGSGAERPGRAGGAPRVGGSSCSACRELEGHGGGRARWWGCATPELSCVCCRTCRV